MNAVYTARISYRGFDRLDVTRKSALPQGIPFAPSWAILGPMLELRRGPKADLEAAWPAYVAAYTGEMRASYRANRAAWDAIVACDKVTLCCYCTRPDRCHRTVLAGIFTKLGCEYLGER